MNYRPITDLWILARPKVKYYGAFPSGFLHRARALMGVNRGGSILHVCGGRVRQYPYPQGPGGSKLAVGEFDMTVDLDATLTPDFVCDVRTHLPCMGSPDRNHECNEGCLWDGIIIDRPYTQSDAEHYAPGPDALPELNALLKRALAMVPVGSRVGVLDYLWPHPGKMGLEVAVVGVGTGRNARARWFTVFERLGDEVAASSSERIQVDGKPDAAGGGDAPAVC